MVSDQIASLPFLVLLHDAVAAEEGEDLRHEFVPLLPCESVLAAGTLINSASTPCRSALSSALPRARKHRLSASP